MDQTARSPMPLNAAARASACGPPDLRMIAALAAVWLFWGSTFAGMRFAVQTIPPFPMAAIRFTVAGLLLYAFCALRGRGRITRDDLIRGAITGSTLLLLGNGMTAWTVQFLPTGINALLLSLVPIWMAIIAFVWGGERPTRFALAGMLVGLAGLALLVWQPQAHAAALPVWPTAVALLASIAWAFGSMYARRAGRSQNLLLATALQMLFGGVLIALEAALFGQWRGWNIDAVSAASLGGLTWLIVFGSLVGYSAYLYTMQIPNVALAAAYSYVNPIVAVLVGIALFHERLTFTEAVASAIIVCGVALMIVRPRPAPHAHTGLGLRAKPR